MAAPTWIRSSNGTVIASGSADVLGWPSSAGQAIGDVVLLQITQDGTGANPTLNTSGGTVENLAGTDDAMTTLLIGQDVGNPAAAKQHVWIGRALVTSDAVFNVSTSGDDLYCQLHRFNNCNTGSALSDVIENSSAGTANNEAGTGTTVTDVSVTTLGADRLAINCVGINDDGTGIAAFAGASGGTWAMPASFASATGTDGTVALMTAAMASAGTIDGGSDTITSDAWGVVGFALIGTTVATPISLVYQPGIQAALPRSLYVR